MPWLLVITAGFFEVAFATLLKLSNTFTRLWPTIQAAGPDVHELTTATITDPHIGTVWRGDGRLSLCTTDAHELGAFAPVETGTAWALQLGFSVTGGTIHELPDEGPGGQP